jgi:hypothetical protein
MKRIIILFNEYSSLFFYNNIIYYLRKYENLNILRTTHLDLLNEDDVVIPIDVISQQIYFKNNIYSKLNNKKICHEMCLKFKDVNHIPTFSNITDLINFIENNDYKKYIVKTNNGFGSFNQSFLTKDYLLNNNYKFKDNTIVQPYFDNYEIHSLDLVVFNGQIEKDYYSKIIAKNGVNFIDFLTNIKSEVLSRNTLFYNTIYSFCKKILKEHNYTGFIEFEFIVKNNNIYFLEINPRITLHLSQIDKNNNSLYFNNIIIPYLNHYDINIDKLEIENTKMFSGSSAYVLFKFIIKLCLSLFKNIIKNCLYTSFVKNKH